jgi:hypothetical protein
MLNLASFSLRFYIARASCLKQFQPVNFVLTSNSGYQIDHKLYDRIRSF